MDDDFIIDDEEIDYNILCNDTLENFPFIEDDVDSITDYELFSRGFGYLDEKKANKSELPNLDNYVTKDTEDLVNYTKTEDLSRVALTGEYNDLNHKPLIPNKTSNLINDSGFIDKNVNDLTYYTKTSNLSTVATTGDYDDLLDKPTIPDVSNFITKDVNDLTYYTLSSNLSTVATSGSYTDLTNKPTIPTKTSDLTNDSGFIANTLSFSTESRIGTYNSKPVYLYVISGTTPTVNYLNILSNVDTLISSSGNIVYNATTGDRHPINMTYDVSNNYFSRVDVAGETNKLYFNYSTNLQSKSYIIMLIYTKTTD